MVVSIEPDEFRQLSGKRNRGETSSSRPITTPFAYPKAVDTFLGLPLSDEDKRKILWDNCARFYGVGVGKSTAAR